MSAARLTVTDPISPTFQPNDITSLYDPDSDAATEPDAPCNENVIEHSLVTDSLLVTLKPFPSHENYNRPLNFLHAHTRPIPSKVLAHTVQHTTSSLLKSHSLVHSPSSHSSSLFPFPHRPPVTLLNFHSRKRIKRNFLKTREIVQEMKLRRRVHPNSPEAHINEEADNEANEDKGNIHHRETDQSSSFVPPQPKAPTMQSSPQLIYSRFVELMQIERRRSHQWKSNAQRMELSKLSLRGASVRIVSKAENDTESVRDSRNSSQFDAKAVKRENPAPVSVQ